MEMIRYNMRTAVVITDDITVVQIRNKSREPAFKLCGDSNPHPILGIAQDKIDLTDRAAVDSIEKDFGLTGTAVHQFQAIGAEVGEDVYKRQRLCHGRG